MNSAKSVFKNVKNIRKEDVVFILFCIMTAVVFAEYRCVTGDFAAYNGDFQNYNIFRRIIEGQVQYRDFTNYLGNGIIFINLPLVFLFNSFGECVFITHFTTSIVYSLIVFISFYTITKERKKAYIITNIIAIAAFVILHMGFSGEFYGQYVYNLVFFEEQGVSMRTTRAFLPFLLVGIIYIIKNRAGKNKLLVEAFHNNKQLTSIFFVMGIMIVWANDYGYSCAACLFMIVVIMNMFYHNMAMRRKIFICSEMIISVLAGALISIIGITHGHIMDYISVNAGIASDQFWYYGNYYGKYLTLEDIFRDKKYVFLTITFLLHAVYFLIRAIRNEISDESICKLFLHGSCYGAALIYVIGSGAHSYAALELITYILGGQAIWKIILNVRRYLKKRNYSKLRPKGWSCSLISYSNIFLLYIFIMLLLYCISVNTIRIDAAHQNGEEIKGLNVYSVIGSGLDECAEKISDGMIFSTYAGALEIINDTLQPSGIDYIIHVLGDEQRQKYLDNFVQGNYQYASTLKNEYTPDEYWLLRTDWYFYRELYSQYEPYAETNYSRIWKKTQNNNFVETEYKVECSLINESTYKIDVELPDYCEGAYVDLLIKYNTEWTKERLKNGGIRKVVCIEDGGEQYNQYYINGYYTNTCYHLKEETAGYELPIYVRNGRGYAYISSYPLSCTRLTNLDVKVQGIIKEPEYALHVTNYTIMCPQIANDGVDQTGTLLKFDNTEFATTLLEKAKILRANNETGIVDSVWKDGDYIYILLQSPINRDNFVYPNKIEVIRR